MNTAFLKRGKTWCAVMAAAFVGWGLSHAVEERPPVGKLEGKVVFEDLNRTLDNVEVVLTPEEGWGRSFRAKTRADGTFRLTHIPEGTYYVSASTRAHQTSSSGLTIYENLTANLTLTMKRSQSEFALKQHLRVYGTKESVHLPVSGYVDGDTPKGQDTVNVTMYKTRLSHVMQNDAASENFEKLGRSWDGLHSLPASLLSAVGSPKPIREQQVKITEDDREGFFYKNLSFGKLPNGLYLVEVAHVGHAEATWLLVTDTAIVTKKAGSQLVAFTVDMNSGKPIQGANVKTYRNSRVVASGKTNANGLAELSVPPVNSNRLITVASVGSDETVVNLNDYGNENQGRFVVSAYTDRPIYRPGQRISFKGIARRRETPQYASPLSASAGADKIAYQYSVPTGQPVEVELRDPSGERMLKQTYSTNRYGSFFGQADLMPEAPTGVYSLIMKVGSETHTHDIVIASYKKPEFEVSVTPEKPRYLKSEDVVFKIKGQYYFGGGLAGAKVSYTILRSPDWTAGEEEPSEGGEDYESGGEYINSGEVTLDENGEILITFPATPEDEKKQEERDKAKHLDEGYAQVENYTVSVQVMDEAERFVEAEGKVKVVPGDFRLSVETPGYVGAPNSPTEIQIAATDYDGKPIAGQPVSVELAFEKWDEEEYKQETLQTLNATTDANGRATISATPPKSGYLLMTAKAKDAHGRSIQAMHSLWVVSDEGGDLSTQYSDLAVLTDKKGYAPGETARVLVNASKPNLTVLLTIEGSRVSYQQLVQMKGRSTVVRVPIRAEYGPNVMLAACYVFKKHIAQSEAQLRVSIPQKEIRVAIEPDRQGTSSTGSLARYQPGDAITYTVKTTDTSGNPLACELSFGVVDEAIYALREDNPKALTDAFYPRRYNQVTTTYSFAAEYLGDADKAEPKIAARKKFPDTAFWNPTLTTDASGTAHVTFNLPDNLTTWRATAVAHTLDTKLGRGIQKVMVNKDFFVRLEQPRFLTVRDESRISAIVHNNTESAQNVQVRLIAPGIALKEGETQSVKVEAGKTGEVNWTAAANQSGTQTLRLTAWTPKDGGKQYTDGVEMPLTIKPHGREVVSGLTGEITDTPQTETIRFNGNAVPENARITVRITPSLLSALTDGTEYLVGFPYGCTEQTLSRFVPDLLVGRMMKQNGLRMSVSSENLSRMVRSGMMRLFELQHSEGDWGWWENGETDSWMTAYAIYGLAIAQKQGYSVSNTLQQNIREGAKKQAEKILERLDRPSSKDSKQAGYVAEQLKTLAFLLYGLALSDESGLVKTYRVRLNPTKMDAEGLAYLVLLQKAQGKSAPEASAKLDRLLVAENGMMHWKAVGADTTGSDLTATAAGLRALLTVNRNDPRIPAILRWLMFKRTDGYWGTTRDTAWTLMALVDYLGTTQEISANGTVALTLNGSPLQTVSLDGDQAKEKEIVIRIGAKQLRPDRNEIRLERNGGTLPVFYAIESRQTVNQDELPAVSNAGIQVKREYRRLLAPKKGNSSYEERTEATQNQMTAGDKIRVRLTLVIPKDMAYVLIEDPFPSGCDPMERGDASEMTEEWKFWYDGVTVRDDRIAFFVRSLPAGTHTIEYNLRAQTSGTCGALPTLLQAMYVPELKAESRSDRVTIARAAK